MNLSEIPIQVETHPPEEGLGGGAKAILYEILTMLERLAETGTDGAVDLRSLPMQPDDWQNLAAALGEGDIDASFHDGAGRSRVRETGIHGVWWIEHRDPDDNVVASFIEVTTVPAILATDPADVRTGMQRLRQTLETLAGVGLDVRLQGGQKND